MDDTVLFSVIIVSWNTYDLTLQAIRSVFAQNDPRVEVLVVDNASRDDSVEKIRALYPNVRLIVNKTNLGYAGANNIGMSAAKGDYFVLLNSDAELMSEAIFAKVHKTFLMNPDVAAVGGKLVLPSGKVQAVGRKFLTLKILMKEQLLFATVQPVDVPLKGSSPVVEADYLPGAFLCVRRHVVEQVGKLNEAYFMYGEDMEWCRRMKRAGWRVVALTDLVVRHHHSASSKQNFRAVLIHNALNNCRYLTRFEGNAKTKTAFDVFLAGMALRIPLSIVRRNGLARDYLAALIEAISLRPRLKTLLRG
jgi:N-acetylglucosaminyl-diphospho-decaprenol L-rhamnosyltransferase